ncbi:putative triacylglycerol lipase [Rosa chinensis]|uniref:Putative triacylglycerol lipase n=1 Tax=Rosa chinensis TaxID=74649 RepID=A0A2P6RLI5_ROSCH|nr:putative triacylglycerol lipase [Rosa chinensis]
MLAPIPCCSKVEPGLISLQIYGVDFPYSVPTGTFSNGLNSADQIGTTITTSSSSSLRKLHNIINGLVQQHIKDQPLNFHTDLFDFFSKSSSALHPRGLAGLCRHRHRRSDLGLRWDPSADRASDLQLPVYGITAILNLSLCDENKELIASSGNPTTKENAACALLCLSQIEVGGGEGLGLAGERGREVVIGGGGETVRAVSGLSEAEIPAGANMRVEVLDIGSVAMPVNCDETRAFWSFFIKIGSQACIIWFLGLSSLKLFGCRKSPPSFLYAASHMSSFKRDILQGVNFASAGSGIFQDTGIKRWTEVVSLGNQIQQFAAVRGNFTEIVGFKTTDTVLSKSLFIISIGSNDLFELVEYFPNVMDLYKAKLMEHLQLTYKNHLKNLYKLGARKFGIISVPPIGCCPYARFEDVQSACCGNGRLNGEKACVTIFDPNLCSNRHDPILGLVSSY